MAELLGKDFTPPDIRAKVTGAARYAEDFRADGMLFCRLLKSPMPHARVKNIDASEALAMDGVVAILTADEVPEMPAPRDPVLTNTPLFVGDPILAVAAVDETTAHDAIHDGLGFGMTIRVINGALECDGGRPDLVRTRINNYTEAAGLMGVTTGSRLGC